MLRLLFVQLVDHSLLLVRLLVSEPSLTARSVPERPALAPWYRMARDNGRVLFEHGGSVVTLEGRAAEVLLPTLLPLLDGTRTFAEIVETLGHAAEPSIARARESLAEGGLLTDGPELQVGLDSAPTAAAAAFVAAATRRATPRAALAALAAADVAVAGESPDGAEIVRIAAQAGLDQVRHVALADSLAGHDLLICAPTPGEVLQLSAVNAARLAHGGAWLSLLPHDGRSVVVGPLYLPGESACYACYRTRRAAASGYEEDYELVEAEPTKAACPAALSAVAAGLVVTLALRWLAVRDSTLPGRCYALETGIVLGLSLHHVLRVPRCAICGPDEGSVPSPWFKETARDD